MKLFRSLQLITVFAIIAMAVFGANRQAPRLSPSPKTVQSQLGPTRGSQLFDTNQTNLQKAVSDDRS